MFITFGSLFAGIGGFDLGFELAGMVCKWQVEIDDYCNKVLEKHWPDVERYRDVKKCGKHNLEPVDVICGGFPCQPHSVAGKRRGAEDDRNLWPEFLRVIRETRPRYVVAENVPGITTSILESVLLGMENPTIIREENQDYFTRIYTRQETLYLDSIKKDLEDLGYTVVLLNIPTCAFDAPHRRERIFVVAHTESKRKGQLSIRQRGSYKTRTYADRSGKDVANSDQQGLSITGTIRSQAKYSYAEPPSNGRDWWTVEPNVGRVAHGVPARVDRLRALGNSVVPQVAEWIGSRIVEIQKEIKGG